MMHKDDGAELLLAVKMMSFQWLLARYNPNLGVNDVFISNVDISHEYLQEIYKIKGEKVKVKNLKTYTTICMSGSKSLQNMHLIIANQFNI